MLHPRRSHNLHQRAIRTERGICFDLLVATRNDAVMTASSQSIQSARAKRFATVLARCSLASALLWGAAAHADDSYRFYGLLRSRDLSPFGFTRLDMRPAHAVAIEPGTWAIE